MAGEPVGDGRSPKHTAALQRDLHRQLPVLLASSGACRARSTMLLMQGRSAADGPTNAEQQEPFFAAAQREILPALRDAFR